MRLLVTAGNTQTPIDRVRCLTNVFTGRTGSRIAWAAHERGHEVCLLTSHPEVLPELQAGPISPSPRWRVQPYSTFADLENMMAKELSHGRFHAVIHAAAVGDFTLGGIYTPAKGTVFAEEGKVWRSLGDQSPRLVAADAGKVSSHHHELWLRLVPAPKLVDKVRNEWGFTGLLVKFKLEVGLADDELLERAERSRLQSAADLLVANTLEDKDKWAFIGAGAGTYEKVPRHLLPEKLLERVESLLRVE